MRFWLVLVKIFKKLTKIAHSSFSLKLSHPPPPTHILSLKSKGDANSSSSHAFKIVSQGILYYTITSNVSHLRSWDAWEMYIWMEWSYCEGGDGRMWRAEKWNGGCGIRIGRARCYAFSVSVEGFSSIRAMKALFGRVWTKLRNAGSPFTELPIRKGTFHPNWTLRKRKQTVTNPKSNRAREMITNGEA